MTVTLKDDFSAFDPAMIPGATLTLRGRQAEIFVRQRMTIGDGTNASAHASSAGLSGKARGAGGRKGSPGRLGFIGTLFDGLKPYMITDLSGARMINEANKAAGYRMEGTLTLPGGHTTGPDGFVEFHADGDALDALVLDVFYTKSGELTKCGRRRFGICPPLVRANQKTAFLPRIANVAKGGKRSI